MSEWGATVRLVKNGVKSEAVINNVSELKSFVALSGEESDITQVNFSRYLKLYYDARGLTDGVKFVCDDENGDRFYLPDTYLCVVCDDEKPVSGTAEQFDEIERFLK